MPKASKASKVNITAFIIIAVIIAAIFALLNGYFYWTSFLNECLRYSSFIIYSPYLLPIIEIIAFIAIGLFLSIKSPSPYLAFIIVLLAVSALDSSTGLTANLAGVAQLPAAPCLSQSGYLCGKPTLNSATNRLSLIVGQATGENWQSVNLIAIPANLSVTNPSLLFNNTDETTISNGLASEQQISVSVPLSSFKTPITAGNGYQIAIWAQYNVSGQTSQYYAFIGQTYLKAC